MDPSSGSSDNLQSRPTTSSSPQALDNSHPHPSTLIGPPGTSGLQIAHTHHHDEDATAAVNAQSDNLRRKFKKVRLPEGRDTC
jgi:hypothetical protein